MNEIKIERISFHTKNGAIKSYKRRYDEDNKQNATVSIPKMVRLRDEIDKTKKDVEALFLFPYHKWCD